MKQLHRVVELLQKPINPDVLADTIEDKEAYEGLKDLMIDVKEITGDKVDNITRDQQRGLFDSLRKIQKSRSFMYFFFSLSTIILSSIKLLAEVI